MNNPQLNKHGELQHLLTTEGLPVRIMRDILDRASTFIAASENRDIKKVPLLQGKSVFNVFFENSTRTRTTFEIAAKKLSADVVNLNIGSSSTSKGETLLDTVDNLCAMHADMFVVRHSTSGAAHLIARHVAPEVRVVAPKTLLPSHVEKLGVRVFHDMEQGLKDVDVVMMLRLQNERMQGALLPSAQEYFKYYGLTQERLALAKSDVIVMHPGPMNRGVEIDSSVADGAHSVILPQVTFGIAVRMAVMATLAGKSA